MPKSFPLLLSATLTLLALAGRVPGGVLTPAMVADLHQATSVALDPAGEEVAYLVEVPLGEDDGVGAPRRELRVVDLTKGRTRRLTDPGYAASPSWTEDGKRVLLLAEIPGAHEKVQVYSVRRRGGPPRLVTRHGGSVDAYRLSADGRRLAFAARDPRSPAKAGADQRVHGEDFKYRHLHVLDLKTQKSRRLSGDALEVVTFEWLPDGRRIVFQATPTPRVDDVYMRRRLYVVDVESSEPRPLAETPGKLGEMAVSPDGGCLAFLGATSWDDPSPQSLFVVALDGAAEARNLTEGYEGAAAHVAFLDPATLLLVAVEREHQVLYRVDVATGSRVELLRPSFIADALDLRAGRLALLAHSASHPRELYVGRADASGIERVEDLNPVLAGVELARQETIEWTGAGGLRIGGVLTYPLGYQEGKRYPLVLQLHGGPEGVSLDGWTTTPVYPVQLLARDGFLVLEPNYRGSRGRGVAFSKGDHGDLGGQEMEDILLGVDALVGRGLADPERVGTGGWSYGGYLSAWAATRWSERFRAAVVGAGITNWISFSGTTDIPEEMSSVHWTSWWHEKPELHWKRSPIAHLETAGTPTLILHGEDDERVDPEQGMELYTALRLKGVPVRFVTYPREGHGLSERAHQIDAMERVLGWFREHMASGPAAAE